LDKKEVNKIIHLKK